MKIRFPSATTTEGWPRAARAVLGSGAAVLAVGLTLSIVPLRVLPLLLPFPIVILSAWYLGMVGGLFTGGTELQFGKDANALIQLAKDAKRIGISPEDAETLLQWAQEYKVNPTLNHIGTTHWVGGSHIRIGPVNHIPVQ